MEAHELMFGRRECPISVADIVRPTHLEVDRGCRRHIDTYPCAVDVGESVRWTDYLYK